MKSGEKRVVVEGEGEGMDGIKPYLYASMSFSNNRRRGTIFPQEAAQAQAGGSAGDYVHMKLRDEWSRSVY